MDFKDKKEIQKRIEFLRQELEKHNYRYYVLNDPQISDFEYDGMMSDLASLEKMYPEFASPDSPTVKVGSDIAGKTPGTREFRQYRHRYPMLSLGNTYNIEELQDFDRRAREGAGKDFNYNCELKFDGTAICLTYSKGRLLRALTRGDGTVGDDVTDNVRTISSIPAYIGDVPWDFEIRGEIYMPFASFNALNEERLDIGDQPFANPRNAAAGSLKTLDPKEVSRRGLECVLYHIIGDGLPFRYHSEALEWAAGHNLPVSGYSRLCHDMEEVRAYISEWDTRGGRPCAPDQTGLYRQIPALGHGIQVQARAGPDPTAVHRLSGRPDRSCDPCRQPRPGTSFRHDSQEGIPAQRRPDGTAGRPHRRLCLCGKRRRDYPEDYWSRVIKAPCRRRRASFPYPLS